jgi:hypothetical protein
MAHAAQRRLSSFFPSKLLFLSLNWKRKTEKEQTKLHVVRDAGPRGILGGFQFFSVSLM